jgi:hypothetical protein
MQQFLDDGAQSMAFVKFKEPHVHLSPIVVHLVAIAFLVYSNFSIFTCSSIS